MWNRQYAVTMQTPIGSRYGTMTVAVDHNRVDGILNILKKADHFDGDIHENGDCRLNGTLTTLMRTIPYEATGRITENALLLTLKGEREMFELSGSAVVPLSSEKKEPAR